ncbi:MAG: BamA/TamA family outer membrane protein, partial [Flavobacteriales bacterium]
IQLHWRRIQNGIQELDASFRYPYVLKTSLGLGGEIEVYRRDSTFSSARLRAELSYLFSFDQSISGFIESWTSNSLQSNFSANADVDITRYGSRLIIGKTDSRINPLNAHHLDIEGSAGFKTIPAIEDNSEDITGEQYVLSFDASFRRKLVGELGFGVLAKGGKKWDNTSFLAGNELFRIGGLNSIRGFNEEQFFAETFAVGGLELVYRLDRSTSIFGFFDQSWYQQNIDDKLEDRPYGFGAGLNLGSKAGQFKLIYALGSQNDSPILFREAKLHFGFINLF